MDEKIVDFQKMSNNSDDELPIAQGDILKRLQEVPGDILNEYIEVINWYVENLLVCKNIVSARDNPILFQHLFSRLNQTQIDKLNHISLYLASKDPIEKVRELGKITFGNVIPTQETFTKATEFIEKLKSLDVDYNEEAKELSKLSKHIQFISEILIVVGMGEQFESLIIDRLSDIYDGDLNELNILSRFLLGC